MELSKNYNPVASEEKWYQHWLNKLYFKSIPDKRPSFTIVIPPPNITGVLHMGHTLNETVQDILIRKARMSGYNACWVPGSDHASIATEAKVVQMLKERGIDKNQLSREEFLKYAYEWKEKYGGIIYNQIAKLGCSVDWDRVSFTMDPDYYKAVIKVFVRLYNKGLVYRGARMIHWDPVAKTALSDEEVEYHEMESKLYYVKYKVEGPAPEEFIIIATQRPETIMGDTAVCVNPKDPRYLHLKGKSAIVPMVNRRVPIIFDDYVDTEFGTGALKITPAHDINDYNLGLKYNLPVIETINEDGTLSEDAQVFVGLDRFEARKKTVERLKKEGLLIKEEDYHTRVGFSQRTNAVIEPRISTQWFVKMKELAGPALKGVLEGDIIIHPAEKFLATYKYWLENVQDWCISRQLWWGQQIPAWFDENGNYFVAENIEEAKLKAKSPTVKLSQDKDVLDTWFSAWLWPIEVFKGISQPGNSDINFYYPGSVLVTGQDIIFFWVARMIMAGYEFQNEKPFEHVYFTGMVRDKQGRKMSKSLGNSPILLELIEKYGADAVRFGILISSPAGNDLLFDEAALGQGSYFNNKLWNALKLVKSWQLRSFSNGTAAVGEEQQSPLDEASVGGGQSQNFAIVWFENRLNKARTDLELQFKEFRLSECLKALYTLIWEDFCSWYLEWVKPGFEQPVHPQIYRKTVDFFEQLIQLLHPFMPFITEEIYHLLKDRDEKDDLCIRQFETPKPFSNKILEQGALLKEVITSIREFRTKNGLKSKESIEIGIESENAAIYFDEFQGILQKQLGIGTMRPTQHKKPDATTVIVAKDKFHIISPLKGIDDGSLKNEMLKELEYLKGFLLSIDKKLSNDRFIKNAKHEVIELERKKHADAEAKIKIIEESLRS
jgi:valyl-tRNA synthetase